MLRLTPAPNIATRAPPGPKSTFGDVADVAAATALSATEPSSATLHSWLPSAVEATASTRAAWGLSSTAATPSPCQVATCPLPSPTATADEPLIEIRLVMSAGSATVADGASGRSDDSPVGGAAQATTRVVPTTDATSAEVRRIITPFRARARIRLMPLVRLAVR
jgi:hypothetical protein